MNTPPLTIGAFGPDVTALQDALKRLGYDTSPSEIQRGFFGPVTRQIVQRFQTENGLVASGKVDQGTAAAINAALSATGATAVSGSSSPAATTTSIAAAPTGPSTLSPAPMAAVGTPANPASSTNAGMAAAALAQRSGRTGSRPANGASRTAPASQKPAVAKTTITAKATTIKISSTNLERPVLTVLTDRTITAATKSALSDSLNTALKSQLATAASQAGYSDLANALQALPAVDITAASTLSVRDFVSRNVTLPADPSQKKAVEADIAKLSSTTTVGDLLGLSSSVQANPNLAPVLKQANLATLLQSSPALASKTALIDDFISRYAGFQGSISDFWNVLGQDDEFKEAVPQLQLTLQLATLTLNSAPLVAALQARYPKMTSPRALTAMSTADWQQMIISQKISVPASISGATPAEQASNYATKIVGTLQAAFPGAYFAQDFQAATATSKNTIDLGVSTFLNNAVDFDILNSNLTNYIAQQGDSVFQGIDATQKTAVTTQIATLQRVAKVAPDFSTTSALLTAGFSSAFDIAKLSRTSFLQRFPKSPVTTIAPEDIHSKAQYIAALSLTAHTSLRQGVTSNLPLAIGSMKGESANLLPTWQTLFGSTSSCACSDCQSVFSAAAYFVNLLQFLKGIGSPGATAYDALMARRPDLPRIKLNCVNTNTELPYVDLVNEILEGFVVINNGNLDATVAHDTSKDATADELSVNPEYTNADAYNKYLNAVVYPTTLPFDRWLKTARTYLNFLGTSLYEIMSACQTGANAADFTQGNPTGIAIACEFLSISEVECIILTGSDFSGKARSLAPLCQYYGYASQTASNGMSWEQDLAGVGNAIGVENFLQRMAITFDDLIALLKTRAINPNLSIRIQLPADPFAACDLTKTTIIGLSVQRFVGSGSDRGPGHPPNLDLIYRFIRLWKKLGWAISDLDKTMTALQATDIDQQFLVSLAAVIQLQTTLNLPLLKVLSFWNDLDTDGRGSLYLSLFQNKAVLNPPDPAFQLNYVAPLASPPTLEFPSPVFPNLTYSSQSKYKLLSQTTPLIGQDEFNHLYAASSDSAFLAAISELEELNESNSVSPIVGLGNLPIATLLNIVLPGFVSYQAGGTLGISTPMSAAQQNELLALSPDTSYQTAVTNLYTTSNAGGSGPFTQQLASLPLLPGFFYNPSATAPQVSYAGPMSDDVRALFNFSSEPAYQTAIDSLYEMRTLLETNLQNETVPMSLHVPAILAALRISAQDLATIRANTNLADPPPPPHGFEFPVHLSVANLSRLCRYAFLAQGLGLSVSDLFTMIALAGTDPFQQQSPTQTLAFVQTVQAVQASPFSIAQLNYLYRDVFDPNASIAPTTASVSSLLAGLQVGLAGIVNADQIVPDPKGDLLTKKLAILLGNSLATTAIGLITGMGVFSAPLLVLPPIVLPGFVTYSAAAKTLSIQGAMTGLEQANLLDLSNDPDFQTAVNGLFAASQAGEVATYTQTLAALPGISFPPLPTGAISYDAAAQQLRFTGAMTSTEQSTLLGLSTDPSYQAAVTSLYDQPIDFITANFQAFLAPKNPATNVTPSNAANLLIENPNIWTGAQKIAWVTQLFMPYLQQVQCKSLVTQTLSDNLGLSSQICGLLLNSLLKSQINPANPAAVAMADFLALVGDGLSANYYIGVNPTGSPALTRIDPTVDFNWGFVTTPDPSSISVGQPYSAEWTGWLIPQYSEEYTFYVMAGDGARLWVNDLTVLLIDRWSDQAPTETLPAGSPPPTITLTAGKLYAIKLDYYDNTAAGIVQLSWSSASTPKAIIPQTQLFSGAVMQSLYPIIQSYTLLYKAGLLISTLPLTFDDVSYFSDPNNYKNFANFDLNNLPLTPPTTYDPALFNQWQRLNAFVNLRSTMPGGDAGLLNIFKIAAPVAAAAVNASPQQPVPALTLGPGGNNPDILTTAIVQATGWKAADLVTLACGFGLTYADFTNEIGTQGIGLIQLQVCEKLLARLGVSAAQLISWSAFGPDPTNVQHIDSEQPIATDIQNTVKAKYDDTTWVTVGKPLNDAIRQASKDALIAYILAGAAGSLPIAAGWQMATLRDGPITTADQLYEFFLIDVEMSTCMLTSRIVQANAAIQLFVQRCLLNLELAVSPAAINTTIWAWMQNFRVWQANVEVFYYPENWMVPTLRDDKTPFFVDLENALLQNPINTDTVEQAYLDYLTALDEVARLDIRGTYWQFDPNSKPLNDNTPDATNDVLHVFARTSAGTPYTYYYRRLLNCSRYGTLAGGAIWTPWEEVTVDIQADHLVPAVWNNRLYLFWPSFAQSAEPSSNQPATATPGQPYSPSAPVMDLSITLNWSEYQNGAWSSKRSSDPLVFKDFASNYGDFGTGNDGTTITGFNCFFRTSIAADNSLSIDIWGDNCLYWGNPAWYLGQFVFPGCGGAPSSQASPPGFATFPSVNPLLPNGVATVIPETILYYNRIVGADCDYGAGGIPGVTHDPFCSGLMLQAGIAGLSGANVIIETVPVLGQTTPSIAQPWIVTFPQQFFYSFWLVMPSIFYVSDGPDLVQPGQPFFYQDNLRVYFVTDYFNMGSKVVYDANVETPVYSRNSLTATQQVGDISSVFSNNTMARLTGSSTSPAPAKNTAGTDIVSQSANLTSETPEAIQFGLPQIQFSTFFHPHVCSFIKAINQYGLANFLSLANQARTNDNGVISGFELTGNDPSNLSNAVLSPGILIAQNQLYEATTPSETGPAPTLTGTYYLFYTIAPTDGSTSPNSFYYSSSQTPRSEGDAFIGAVGTLFGCPYRISGPTVFEANYQPNTSAISPYTYPHENVDFSPAGAYSIYNWELFFHIPLLIATQLSANQQFQDAQTWFHYIFNPTTNSPDPIPQRYWNFLPFYECAPFDTLKGQILLLTGLGPSLCGQGLGEQLASAALKPFNPWAIGRLRTIALRMKVVMAYLDNLIAWGDNLFAQNTRESINEATQIYVLAKEILGPRPIQIPQPGPTQDYSYNDLVTLFGIDSLGNAMVLIENDLPYVSGAGIAGNQALGVLSMSSVIPYFCLPANDTLDGYWDTVDDRLYKIRHCMNIQGVVQQLPLFAPAINPALLVAAEAAGVDLSSVLSNINAATPFYRFSIMVQKALELCSEVRSFGAALLSALEKKDAEGLALLRANQETSLLQAMQQMKEYAVQEAEATLAGLQASLTTATDRQKYYNSLLQGGLSPEENQQQGALNTAADYQEGSIIAFAVALIGSAIPEFSTGVQGAGGTPKVTMSYGGSNLASAANATAAGLEAYASSQSTQSSSAGLSANWNRRNTEWQFQAAQANDEMAQINAQISAANFRIQIAQEDQKNLTLQIQNAQAVQDFLTGKYTNQQLYSWMVDQISTVFFQCYQMAYNLATQAEAAFRFERCLATSNYIQFGYWDSLKKGLMSGERLYADIKRMELAFLQTDFREYEIRKSISLVLFDPWALINLKETGQCVVNLPEAFFDMDYPDHYFRRVKTVSLTIPSVAGPYTSVNCTLTLLNSKIRVDTSPADYGNDAHFITNSAATQSIATSTAQDDHGMFEVNFHDERYLPFEGAGLISTWQIDMPINCNAFDFESISDVVINISYTARYGGDPLREAARKAAIMPSPPAQSSSTLVPFPMQKNLQRLISLKHEYQSEWYKFLNPVDASANPSMQIALDRMRFPYQYRSATTLTISQVQVVLMFKSPQFAQNYQPLGLTLGPPGSANPTSVTLPITQGLLNGVAPVSLPVTITLPIIPAPSGPGAAPPSWTLIATTIPPSLQPPDAVGATPPRLNPDAIADILLLCQFGVTWS